MIAQANKLQLNDGQKWVFKFLRFDITDKLTNTLADSFLPPLGGVNLGTRNQ